ncbi:unnamed protein product [Adineta ricciae]|uniref:LIM zinc-binding domain-containing protein n=2 Tax=Adineta ricciae TaxID=249248 RepID=A0A813N4L8_ADIRI|nr:unnamed protein product [Adineta ricciae]
MYAEYCDTCGERIETDQAQMAHESQHWHATDACFYCYTCRAPLLNRAFFPRYGALFCSNECALQRNNRFNHSKLIQQKYDKSPDLISTTQKHTNQHVRIVPGRAKNYVSQQPTSRSISSRPKDQAGYISDGSNPRRHQRDSTNGYLSDGHSTRRYRNSCQQYPTKLNYGQDQAQVFSQFQSSPESILKNRHEKPITSRSRSREPMHCHNDLNLDQLDRQGATLEIAHCSTAKTPRSSLPDLSTRMSRANSDRSNYAITSHETLTDCEQGKTYVKHLDPDEIMYPISRPKSVVYPSISTQFPRSRSLNGSGRFTKQHHVRFVDDEKEKPYKQSPVPTCRSDRSRLSSSSSSSSSDSDNDEDCDSIYRQYDIHGNRIKRPISFGTKISYVDENGLGKNSFPSTLTKKAGTLNKKEKKSNGGRRRRTDCIIS